MTENPLKHTNKLVGTGYFFFLSLFLLFAFPPTKPNTLHSSCHHAKCLPFDGISTPELGRVGVCMGWDFCEFRVKPTLQLTRGQFCSISTFRPQLGMGPRCFSVAVSTWLVATCLSHKVQARFKHVLWCVYLQFGDAGCSGWIAVHTECSKAEKQCEGIRPQHKNT